MSLLQKESPVPLYQQIQDWIKNKIIQGEWKKREKIPSETDLSLLLGVSRGTVKQAIKNLIEESVLIQQHGKGTFVAWEQMENPLAERLISIAEALTENNKTFNTQVLDIQKQFASYQVSKQLKINEGEEVYCLRRIRCIDNQPAFYLENFLPMKWFLGLDRFDFSKKTLFSVIENDYGTKIDFGKRTFVAKGAEERISTLLEIEKGTPVTFLEQVIFSEDKTPLEYSKVWIRNDEIKLTSTIKRF